MKSGRLVQKLTGNSITKSLTSVQGYNTSGIASEASESELWKKSAHMYFRRKKKYIQFVGMGLSEIK